jgi:hypothetical protein
MKNRDDARTTELINLRLALATFALQLDAFEMRTSGVPPRAGPPKETPLLIPGRQRGLPKERDDWLIKSHGSKSAG